VGDECRGQASDLKCERLPALVALSDFLGAFVQPFTLRCKRRGSGQCFLREDAWPTLPTPLSILSLVVCHWGRDQIPERGDVLRLVHASVA
jgi:hypothetical protein